ncbi:putative nonaspanin (TM9SF) [Helianthus debilis subsp. tardiflorus]
MSFILILLDIVSRERYNYYKFPFCSPDFVREKDNIGKMLTGESLVSTPFIVGFRVDKEHELLCKKRLNKSDVSLFRSMIKKGYQMQLYYDDLPIRGLIGRNYTDEKNNYFLYRHSKFLISYNKEHVIAVSLTYDLDSTVDVTDDVEINVDFTYSVIWWETERTFDERLDIYETFFYFTTSHTRACLLICKFMFHNLHCDHLPSHLLHTISSQRNFQAEVNDNHEQKGWKNIRGDVFRFPKHKSLFSAALGSGTQLLVVLVFPNSDLFYVYFSFHFLQSKLRFWHLCLYHFYYISPK